MSFIAAAPVSAMTALAAALVSSALICLGMKERMIAISSRSCAASSGRLPASKAAADSSRWLDHLGKQQENLVVAQKLAARLGARGDVAILERSQHHAQSRQPAAVLGLHGLFHLVVELLAQTHESSPFSAVKIAR